MRRARVDAGETLVEILLSITIMGIAVLALLSGMGTAATTSGLNARQTGQLQGLQSYVQAVLDAPYVACATTGSYAPGALGWTDPLGYAVSVSAIRYQQVGGYTSAGLDPYGPSCPSAPDGDQATQQLTVLIHQTDGRVRDESVVVVKRRPCATTDPSC